MPRKRKEQKPKKMSKPKKELKHKKESEHKNIIQNVIVKVGADEKSISNRKKRTYKKKPVEKQEVNVMTTVPPNVIYQTQPIQIPPSFSQTPQPTPFSEPVKKTLAEMATMTEPVSIPESVKKNIGIQESVKKRSVSVEPMKPNLIDIEGDTVSIPPQPEFITPVPITIKRIKRITHRGTQPYTNEELMIKQGNIEILGDELTKDEFPPTANFISPVEKQKSQETPDKVYTEEPQNFKSVVSGNQSFGVDISQVEATPIPQAINVMPYPMTKEMKVIAKMAPKGQRTITSFINPNEEPSEELHVLTPIEIEKSDKMQQIKKDLGPKKKEMNELKNIRDRYEKEFGTKYDNTTGKLIGIKDMKQRLGIV